MYFILSVLLHVHHLFLFAFTLHLSSFIHLLLYYFLYNLNMSFIPSICICSFLYYSSISSLSPSLLIRYFILSCNLFIPFLQYFLHIFFSSITISFILLSIHSLCLSFFSLFIHIVLHSFLYSTIMFSVIKSQTTFVTIYRHFML